MNASSTRLSFRSSLLALTILGCAVLIASPSTATAQPGFFPIQPGFQPIQPGFQPIGPGFQPLPPGLQPIQPGFQPLPPGFQPIGQPKPLPLVQPKPINQPVGQGTTVTVVNDTRFKANLFKTDAFGRKRLVATYAPNQQRTVSMPGGSMWSYDFEVGPGAAASGSFSVAAFGNQKVYLSGRKPELNLPQPRIGLPKPFVPKPFVPNPVVPVDRRASVFAGTWKGTWTRNYNDPTYGTPLQEDGTSTFEFKGNDYSVVDLDRFGKLDYSEQGCFQSKDNFSLDLIYKGKLIPGKVTWTGPTSFVWKFTNLNGIRYEYKLHR